MKLKPWQKNGLSMLVIVGGGFGLFMVAFISAAAVFNIYNIIFRQFSSSPGVNGSTMHTSGIYIYLTLILLLSWFIFRSRLNDLAKATYLTMPLMIVLILDGIILNQQPQWVILAIGAVIVGAILFYLYKKKLSWLYYFSTIYVAVLALYVMLSKMEI